MERENERSIFPCLEEVGGRRSKVIRDIDVVRKEISQVCKTSLVKEVVDKFWIEDFVWNQIPFELGEWLDRASKEHNLRCIFFSMDKGKDGFVWYFIKIAGI